MTLRPLSNALIHIRSHAEMYLPNGRRDPADFAERLVGDALLSGAHKTLVAHEDDDWWIIAADIDWLASAGKLMSELFSTIVPFPEAGDNSMHSEVLLGAFAEQVATWAGDDSERESVVGGSDFDPPAVPSVSVEMDWRRVVAFRLEPVNAEASRAAVAAG